MVGFIELSTPEALAAIRDIAADVWPKTFRNILSPEQIVYMMEMMYAPAVMERELASGVRFELVTVDGEPAGYLAMSAGADPGTAKLHKVYLLEKFHGRGIGSAMLRHAGTSARRDGFTRLQLNVNKRNERAIRAYRRNGFVTVAAVKNDIGGGFFMDDYVMEKAL